MTLLALAALAGPAWANGQTTHVHISLDALTHLPEGGLRALLTREDLLPYLVNGTMFPDGGYPLGDDYAEIAHWEPFQNPYERWIMASWEGLGEDAGSWPDEAAQHLAFRMGLASHGMADQFFDAAYMERSRHHDAALGWAEGYSMDESTDVVYGALAGGLEPPEPWFPGELFVQLYQAEAGHTVSVDTMTEGQQLLGLAIRWIAAASQQEALVADHTARFPWAAEHLDDGDTPGSPPCEGAVVAQYWQAVWARMQGAEGFGPVEVLGSVPAEGQQGWPLGVDSPDGLLHVVFSRGLDPGALDPAAVRVVDGQGDDVPVSLRVFYGWSSHVLNIAPDGGWAEDTDYTVTIAPGVSSFDGHQTTAAWTLRFSTRPPPAPQTPTAELPVGCSSAPALGSLVGPLVLAAAMGWRRRWAGGAKHPAQA